MTAMVPMKNLESPRPLEPEALESLPCHWSQPPRPGTVDFQHGCDALDHRHVVVGQHESWPWRIYAPYTSGARFGYGVILLGPQVRVPVEG